MWWQFFSFLFFTSDKYLFSWEQFIFSIILKEESVYYTVYNISRNVGNQLFFHQFHGQNHLFKIIIQAPAPEYLMVAP